VVVNALSLAEAGAGEPAEVDQCSVLQQEGARLKQTVGRRIADRLAVTVDGGTPADEAVGQSAQILGGKTLARAGRNAAMHSNAKRMRVRLAGGPCEMPYIAIP